MKKIKLIISIFILLGCLSFSISYASNVNQSNRMDRRTYSTSTVYSTAGGLISYDDLQKIQGLFCRQHGTFIAFEDTGEENHIFDADTSASPYGTSDMTVYLNDIRASTILGYNKVTFNDRFIQPGDLIQELYIDPNKNQIDWYNIEKNEDPIGKLIADNPFNEQMIAGDWQELYIDRIKTISQYYLESTTSLTPIEAYILSHSQNKDGVVHTDHNFADKVQYAYWLFQNGGNLTWGANEKKLNAKEKGLRLYKEAIKFSEHISKIQNGNLLQDNSNYPPQNGYPAANEVSVSFSEKDNSYLVGPFRITYNQDILVSDFESEMAIRQSQDAMLNVAGANGKNVLFGALVGSKLSGNAGEVKGYSFICENSVQNNLFPSSGEEFYIKIPYSGNENFTTLTNLSFTYYSLERYGGSKNNIVGIYSDLYLCITRENGINVGPYSSCSAAPICNGGNSESRIDCSGAVLSLENGEFFHYVHGAGPGQHGFIDNLPITENHTGICEICKKEQSSHTANYPYKHNFTERITYSYGDGICDNCGCRNDAKHIVDSRDGGHCSLHGDRCTLSFYAKTEGGNWTNFPYNIPIGSHMQGIGYTIMARKGKYTGAQSQSLFGLNSAEIGDGTYEINISFNIPLTMHIGGKVWEDDLTGGKESTANGVNTDANDKPVQYVEVILHRLDETVVKTTETDSNGNWSLTDIPIAQRYYVEFKYNGMVYQSLNLTNQFAEESTNKIVTDDEQRKVAEEIEKQRQTGKYTEQQLSELKANMLYLIRKNKYMNNVSERNTTKYYNNSKAVENTQWRIDFNNKFATITNDKITDKDTGEAYSNNNIKTDLEYNITENNGTNQNTALLITTDANGRTLDKYKISATTKEAGINRLAIDESIHISNINRTVAGITYNRVYPYLEHINLGLARRSVVDLDVREDVSKSVVTINKNEMTYNYNRRTDMEGLEIDIKDLILSPADSSKIVYNTALYKSDYNYRITDYSTNNALNDTNNEKQNTEALNKIISSKVDEEELKVFVTYKIRVTNKSVDEQNYVGLNELVNYYDDTYTLVDKDKALEIYKNATTQETEIKIVAKASSYRLNTDSIDTEEKAIKWDIKDNKVNGYKVMTTTSLKDVRMKPGEYAIISVTFEVNKQDYDNLKNAVIRGDKEQYIEVKSYSTYYDNNKNSNGDYTNTNYLGKIDVNSAPYNYTPGDKNYETDTSTAPVINIDFRKDEEEERKINGIVWEDSRTNTLESGQIVGDGELKDTEKTKINGVTIQLVELVKINAKDKDGNIKINTWLDENGNETTDINKAKEYEYIWREMSTGEDTYKYVDNNGNVNDTAKEEIKNDTNSPFRSFLNISAEQGKYEFSQFVSGNFVVRFKYGDTNKTVLKTADGGANDKSYNGQDYKSTAYQTGKNSLKEEWFDLAKYNNNEKISDAKDNEAQRLRQIKYSSTISNYNGSVLASPDRNPYKTEDDKKLILELEKETWMYADTAKISIRVEYNTNQINENDSRSYTVNNIDLGLEERPKTNIVLNKEISRLRLILANGKTQIDSNADLMQNVNGNLKKDSIRDTINRTTLINLDKELMQGATIIIDYKFTISNNSEIDTVAGDKKKFLDYISSEEIPKIEGKDSIGTYLGSTYYTGKYDSTTEVATLRVNKLLDYVDNNITFRQLDNADWDLYTLNTNSLEDGSKTYKDLQKIFSKGKIFNEDNLINGNIELKNNSMVVNETLKDDDILPFSTREVGLALTKVLSPENDSEEMIYGNIAEILQVSTTTGRRDYASVPGNQNPDLKDPDIKPEEPDTDWAKNVSIIPPTGETPIYYVIGFVGAIILIAGIIIIKKFVLDSKK